MNMAANTAVKNMMSCIGQGIDSPRIATFSNFYIDFSYIFLKARSAFETLVTDTDSDFVCLAGGSVKSLIGYCMRADYARNTGFGDEINDFDFFYSSKSKMKMIQTLLHETCNYVTVFECPEGELISLVPREEYGLPCKMQVGKIQLIFTKHSSPTDLIKSFDFTVCMYGMTCKELDRHTGSVYVSPRSLLDTMSMMLCGNVIEYPIASLGRLSRYISKGYKLPEKDNAALMIRDALSKRIAQAGIEDPNGIFRRYID